MRRFRSSLAALILATIGLAFAQIAPAQQEACSFRSSSVQNIACLRVATTSIEVGDNMEFSMWREVPVPGGYARQPGIMVLRDGLVVIHQDEANLENSYVVTAFYQFVTLGQHPLSARYSTTVSPQINIDVRARTPRFNLSVAPAVSRLGQTVQLSNDTLLFRPNGVMAFFVRPPGGVPTEFARRTANFPTSTVILNDRPTFAFVAPYNVPGEYRFFAKYLGDPLNLATQSHEVSVRVGPFPTNTSLTQSLIGSKQGVPFNLTATVAGTQTGNPAPTGTVEFYDGTTLLGSGSLNAQLTATFTGRLGNVGAHSLTARYLGDTNNQASASTPLSHEITVNPAFLVPIFELLLN